ncbi:feruloyl esterase b [Venturia nashicola]|uniref:Carboxylic ester hydrolase n=1 Tax=Venturia nashicola TaxID=86259 RepID=A0A4Z1P3N7_9PEZI|nr:feruloyl esterase b [Venturia nashicola]TLD36090.1 feruloyl esterase b [Venturia nashicola]
MRLSLSPLLFSLAAAATNTTFQQTCANAISTLQLPNTTVWESTFIPAGTNLTFPGTNATCARTPQLIAADFCRITMYVSTTNRSGISMEAWLPSSWTGRFLSTGNGGLQGCIQYIDMAYASGLGFATVGANAGHNGTSGGAFHNNEDVVIDFAWRSVHTNVLIGKEVTKQFYGEQHKKSFYLGCSTGGRQGMKSVQMFPNDFDGVVVGAPAIAFNNLTSWSGKFFLETGTNTSSTFVTAAQWTAIAADIMAQCDGLDGVRDGIIEDPNLCNYRPENLLCSNTTSGHSTSTCLTGIQANTVRQIFSPFYGSDGHLIYPRMQPGSELSGSIGMLYGGIPFPFTTDWFRYAVHNDPTWQPSQLSMQDVDIAYRKNPGNVQSWEGDLSSFHNAGGKILHYHGLADQIISSDNSPRYYDFVARTMGQTSAQLDDWYRFFRISGMGHCSKGPGAWEIGQSAGFTTKEASGNVLMAMVQWVEGGAAPETVTGVKFFNNTQTLGVQMERRHCRWPRRNTYLGGDAGKADSWVCK